MLLQKSSIDCEFIKTMSQFEKHLRLFCIKASSRRRVCLTVLYLNLRVCASIPAFHHKETKRTRFCRVRFVSLLPKFDLELVVFAVRSTANKQLSPSNTVALSSMTGESWRVAPACGRVESRMLHALDTSSLWNN